MSGPALEVVLTDPTPPYEQLRRQVSALIAAGSLRTGDRLPPVRQLAADLGLASGTVARTYRELEAAGLVETRRGGGTRVASAPTLAPERRRELLDAQARDFVRQARLVGASDAEAADALARALASPAGR